MNFEDRKPKQLEIKRNQYYDRVYPRQKQLMERLNPFLNKSDIIEAETEPLPYFKKLKPKEIKLKEIERKTIEKIKTRRRLRKELNKFSNNRKRQKRKTRKKVSQIRPDVLWGMR